MKTKTVATPKQQEAVSMAEIVLIAKETVNTHLNDNNQLNNWRKTLSINLTRMTSSQTSKYSESGGWWFFFLAILSVTFSSDVDLFSIPHPLQPTDATIMMVSFLILSKLTRISNALIEVFRK
jgi:hypothetical protein